MNKKIVVPLTLVAMLLLAAYGWYSSVSAKPLSNIEKTQQAATTTASIPSPSPTSIPTLAPSATPSAALPTATDTQVPTPTQLPNPASAQADNPAAGPINIPIPTQLPAAPACDMAAFLGDAAIPDGTILNPGDSFTKVWQLKNVGSCSWSSGSALVFVSGDLMGGTTTLPIPNPIQPGETIDLGINLIAPSIPGSYQGNWMLRDANGTIFGTGANANQAFWVNIVVSDASPFAVTSVTEVAAPVSYTGDCPVTAAIDATITTNGAGTVTYYWQRSDGTRSAVGTLTYTAAGSQTVEDGWTVSAPGTNLSGWDQIYIDQPNHQLFDPTAFSVICNPSTPTALPTAVITPTPTQPAPTATATLPPPAPTMTQPLPTATPTQPAPTATPTQPAPTATPTQPAPTATPTQPAPTATPTQPAPTTTPTQPAPTATPTRPQH